MLERAAEGRTTGVADRRLEPTGPRQDPRPARPGQSEVGGRGQSRSRTVLVEPPPVVGPGEGDPVGVDLRQPPPGGHRGRGVERVLVLHPVDHGGRVDEVLAAEGHEVVGVGGEPLEAGEVVRHRDGAGRRRRAVEVPRRARSGRIGEQRDVGVEQRDVGGVGHRRQQLALERRRRLQHRERLGGVGGDDDGVVRRRGPAAVGDLDTRVELAHRGDLGVEPDLLEAGRHGGDVGARAAGHGAPRRRSEDAQHAVVLEEREEEAGGVVERGGGVARPHGRHQGLHEVAHEVGREAAGVEELAQRLVVVAVVQEKWRFGVRRSSRTTVSEQRPGPTVEPRDLGQHPPVGRRPQRRPGGEQAARAERTGVLHSGPGVADGQRHLRGLGLDAELGEEPQQGGVGPAVVDDEAGVDGQLAVGGRHPVGVGVAAEAVVGLEEGDVRGARGHPGSRQASNSRTDDGHASVGATGHAASEKSKRAIGSVVGSSDPAVGLDGDPDGGGLGGRALQHHRLVGGVGHQPGRHHARCPGVWNHSS